MTLENLYMYRTWEWMFLFMFKKKKKNHRKKRSKNHNQKKKKVQTRQVLWCILHTEKLSWKVSWQTGLVVIQVRTAKLLYQILLCLGKETLAFYPWTYWLWLLTCLWDLKLFYRIWTKLMSLCLTHFEIDMICITGDSLPTNEVYRCLFSTTTTKSWKK